MIWEPFLILFLGGFGTDIDFGHFLGNWQKWKGVKRDRAPFVFTPEFAYVMGGKNSPDFERFCQLACSAFNVVRKHSHVFINLFCLVRIVLYFFGIGIEIHSFFRCYQLVCLNLRMQKIYII